MTTIEQEIGSASGIDSILKGLAESHNRLIDEQLAAYDSASVEIRNADENCQRFKKAAEASKAAAEAINVEIHDALRSGEVGYQVAHKKRAARAGHLEDVEIYLSMTREAMVSRKSSELKAAKAATAINGLMSQGIEDAERALTDYLTAHLAEYRPLMLFLGVVSERAGRGDSVHYNARPDIHNQVDFALIQLGRIIHSAFSNGVPEDHGSGAFLHKIPSEISKKALTPLQIKAIEHEISTAAEAL